MANTTIQNGKTCLEARGMEERKIEINRSDYNSTDFYDVNHPDARSTGDEQGKGTGGGHTFWLPNCNADKNIIDYRNFDTEHGGGKFDIEGRAQAGESGRNYLMGINLYNKDRKYGSELVDTSENRNDGQYFHGQNSSTK